MLKRIGLFLILGAAGMLFQSCGTPFEPAGEGKEDQTSKSSTCDEVMKGQFARGYYPLVRRFNCQSCHAPGGLKSDAPFAQGDLANAFADFKNRGPLKINSRFAEGHNASVLGYTYTTQLETELRGLQTDWAAAENSCASSGTSVLTAGQEAGDLYLTAKIGNLNDCGIGDPLRPTHESFPGLTFDLGQARPDLAGISLKVRIKAESPATIGGNICAHQGYRAGNITVTTDKRIRIKNLRILLNGNSYEVNTFLIEREFQAGASNAQMIESLNGGYGVFNSGSAKASDKWSIFIENLEVLN
jgi:hypothetical protein